MRELKRQLVGALIVILTMAAVICAGINLQQQKRFRLPEDGVVWVDRTPDGQASADPANPSNRVVALHVQPQGQADRSGIREGDVLKKINGAAIQSTLDVPQVLVRLGAWAKAEYYVERRGVEVKYTVVVAERSPDAPLYYQYLVGAAYLFIGLFVYFRRGGAPKAVHFYILCLSSFILSTFHYTGKLNNFDKIILLGNVVAGVLVPTLFVHFCLSFPEPVRRLRGLRSAILYVPAIAYVALYVAIASGTLRVGIPLTELRWMLDRAWLPFLCAMYLIGAALLNWKYRGADDPIVRQQLKWLRNGAVLGIMPFTIFYVVPYTVGFVPSDYMAMAVLSLPLIPLTWAYAILRYRLMDVDVIFQQGYVYTLATLCVIGIFYGLLFSLGKIDDLSPSAVVSLILIATFVFQPIRNWLQEVLDRYYFYKDRYDYRRTLIEFARELGSETDLDQTLSIVAERLRHTLFIEHVAFFVLDEADNVFRSEFFSGRRLPAPAFPDLSFLPHTLERSENYYLFFERTRNTYDVISQDQPASVRQTIADLDLTYYIPCTARGRIVAYLGVSRTDKGDFLSSDDIEMLITLSGYVGISIENARLYRSLERKVEQYERLKEFSENIVESINVGILAAGLDDRVESWNTQIERLTGIRREDAVGRRLSELFPIELCNQFEAVRQEHGVHNIYQFEMNRDDMPALVASHNGNGNGNGNGHHPPTARATGTVTMNIAVAPLFSKDQERIGRLIIFDDVTERAELERRLMQADKLSSIGLLAAGVAHEVNTPLAVISTYAQMLAKQLSGDDQKSKLLEKIAKQTFRASEIVNSLLNFSRTSSTEFDEIDLNKVLRETLSLIEPQLQKARVDVDTNLSTTLPSVRGNAGKLQQVFLNLFLNARDAMEGGGRLVVESHHDGEHVFVDVIDTGAGIPAELMSRIYDPFFTTKGSKKGTGLGLAVTYGIVKEHGGSIEVFSRPGAGTRFHLDFPLARKAVNA